MRKNRNGAHFDRVLGFHPLKNWRLMKMNIRLGYLLKNNSFSNEKWSRVQKRSKNDLSGKVRSSKRFDSLFDENLRDRISVDGLAGTSDLNYLLKRMIFTFFLPQPPPSVLAKGIDDIEFERLSFACSESRCYSEKNLESVISPRLFPSSFLVKNPCAEVTTFQCHCPILHP